MACITILLLNIFFRTNWYFRVLIKPEKGDLSTDKGPKSKKKESKAVDRENWGAS